MKNILLFPGMSHVEAAAVYRRIGAKLDQDRRGHLFLTPATQARDAATPPAALPVNQPAGPDPTEPEVA